MAGLLTALFAGAATWTAAAVGGRAIATVQRRRLHPHRQEHRTR